MFSEIHEEHEENNFEKQNNRTNLMLIIYTVIVFAVGFFVKALI